MMDTTATVLLIGIGNPYRQDDSLGVRIAGALQGCNLPDIRVIEHSGEGVSLMDAWGDADAVVVVDAVSSGAEPGRIYQFLAHEQPLPARFFAYSTHDFGLAEAVELARSLGELPPRCIVFGIEGAHFSFGTELSSEVKRAMAELIPVIVRTLEELRHGG